MKRIAAFFVISFFSTTATFAQNDNGRSAINIRMNDNSPLVIAVDGRHFKKHGPSLTIGDLPAGIHGLTVYYYNPNTEYGNYRPHPQLAYKGRINIEAGAMYYCIIDGYSRSITASRIVEGKEQSYPIAADNYIDNHNDNNTYRDGSNQSPDIITDNNVPPINNSLNGLSNNEMILLKTKVDGKIGDADKLKVMQEYLSDKPFTTAQISEMMDWLNFETTRLDLAKWGYDKTGDHENYPQLRSKFSFQRSKSDLDDFIAHAGNSNTSGNKTYSNPDYYGNNNSNRAPYNNANVLPRQQMSLLKKSVAEKITDSDKLKLMEQFLADKTLTTNQVAHMMDWLSFESTRLDIAKYCYNKVTDPENYLQISNKFTFQSSKSELEDLMYKR